MKDHRGLKPPRPKKVRVTKTLFPHHRYRGREITIIPVKDPEERSENLIRSKRVQGK